MQKIKNNTQNRLEEILKKERAELLAIAEIIIKQTDAIDSSWSKSWVGYHASLYFGDFEKPNLDQMFDSEWGGIHSFDRKWKPKSLDEVWERIHSKSSIKFDIDTVHDRVDKIVKLAEELKVELEIGIQSETLKEKVRKTEVSFGFMDYVRMRQPGRVMSRDSRAASQGMQVPPHIQCAGFGQAIRNNMIGAEKILKLASLSAIPESKKSSRSNISPKDPTSSISHIWQYTNPLWYIWSAIKFLKKHQVGTLIGVIIAILTLLAIDYSLAWRNLIWIWAHL